jgi:hypothetical protein
MNEIESLRELYTANGFPWASELEAFVNEVGEKTVYYTCCSGKVGNVARFCLRDLIRVGASAWEGLARHLGASVVPVGECERGEIDLFLTDSGELIGVREPMLFRWGLPGFHWRASLKLLLDGVPAEHFDTLPCEE